MQRKHSDSIFSKDDRIMQGVALWCSFYRANPHRFAKDYLNISLKLFQQILLFMMNVSHYFIYIAARGQGKSYLIAIFCCIRAILYPGTRICVSAGSRGQSINVLEKIQSILMPESPLLRSEITEVVINQNKAAIEFKNGSVIKVVTANDRARGNRSNIIVIDEFRMVDKDIINTVLRKFNTTSRQPKYLSRPEYAHLQERNKEIYLSSAFFKSHWSFDKVTSFCKGMLDDTKRYFVCGLPYQLSIMSGLLSAEQVADEMSESDFNSTQWEMEMECLWFGDTDGSFFEFDAIAKNRKLKYPMLPEKVASLVNNKLLRILPKHSGEKRILSADIALMASKKNRNDAAALFINQLIPTKTERYINNFVYLENSEGEHTEDLALKIRRYFSEYHCDYIVLDCKGIGFGVFDKLVTDIVDDETGEIYPALSCCNNQEMAERCKSINAPKVIWAINATAKFNSDCALMFREGLHSGKIRLLVTEYEGEELLKSIVNGFVKL